MCGALRSGTRAKPEEYLYSFINTPIQEYIISEGSKPIWFYSKTILNTCHILMILLRQHRVSVGWRWGAHYKSGPTFNHSQQLQ